VGSSAAELRDTYVSEATQSMIRAIHGRCEVGSVRDPHAQQVVARAGVENVLMTGCPVLFWAANGELPRVEKRPRRKLVLTARNWLMHRWPDNVDHPLQIELLKQVVNQFSQHPMVFAVHEEFDRSLVQKLGIPPESVIDTNDPQDYVRLYSDPQNVVLAMRLHAGMLARGNGLAAVFVGHDTRTYAFCDMTGIECINLFDDDAAKRTIASLEAALSGEAQQADHACERFADLRDAMTQFLEANQLPARRGEVHSS
jgi:polysaccharide pyruvyl transferase WcaK-like protein